MENRKLAQSAWIFTALSILISAVFVFQLTVDSKEQTDEQKNGLKIRLSEGQDQPEPKPAGEVRQVHRADLSGAAISRLLRRLPPGRNEAEAQSGFSFRAKSLPPPRSGEVIEGAFQPSDAAEHEANAPESLEVLRISPEGDIAIAPYLSITFSQPMIPLMSRNEVESIEVPVRLSPQPKGRWRWVGTKTLLFEPEGRFPMATNYTVEIPAGTKSVNGGVLSEGRKWEFRTPAPVVIANLPKGQSQSRDPLLYLEFDQQIDPESVIEKVRLTSGDRSWPLRLATSMEIETDENVKAAIAEAKPNHWIALRVDQTNPGQNKPVLPADTNMSLSVDAGTPSAEGPLRTNQEQTFTFRTYGLLKLLKHHCAWNSKPTDCEPGSPWNLQFSNPISEEFDAGMIRVEPELIDFSADRQYGGTIFIHGKAQPRKTYTITISGEIRDIFGQMLEEDVAVTINTSGLEPSLAVPGNPVTVLDPSGNKSYPIYSLNYESVKVRLYSVEVKDFFTFIAALREFYTARQQSNEIKTFPDIGRIVLDKTIALDSRPDEIAETRIDLTPGLRDGLGHVLLIIEPVTNVITPDGPQFFARWIQSTNIGLDAFADSDSLLVWATSLRNAEPLSGVQISLMEEIRDGTLLPGNSFPASADGTIKIPLSSNETLKLLVARKGPDSALLQENLSYRYEGRSWIRRPVKNSLRWHVIDDRGVYRPGEEVHIKGWVRSVDGSSLGDIGLPKNLSGNLSYTLMDSQDNEIAKGELGLTKLGGFDLAVKLPENANLGPASLELKAAGIDEENEDLEYEHRFQVQEFRRPEFEAVVSANEGPHFVGGHADLLISANYYTGGALPDTEVSWNVYTDPAVFTPPNRDGFSFGKWVPWWEDHSDGGGDSDSYHGRTDSEGKHRLRIDFESVNPPRPTVVTVNASAEDVNRQRITAGTGFIVHPAALYVGLRSPRLFVEKGNDLVVEAIVTDLEGKAVSSRDIAMRIVRVDWKYEKGEWGEREVDPHTCRVTSAAEAVTCRFPSSIGGRYKVTAEVIDDEQRRNQSELTLWVSGGRSQPENTVTQQKVELVPGKKVYGSGETAEVLIQSPFAPAEGLVTLQRSGIVSTERFRTETGSYLLRIPILESYVPNIRVQVDLDGETLRTDDEGNPQQNLPKRPAFASGKIDLTVSTAKRVLKVEASPRIKTLEPGGKTTVDLMVRDYEGRPVSAGEVTLIVVDEAVLALTNYDPGDPVKAFYVDRESAVSKTSLRENILLTQPADLLAQGSEPLIDSLKRRIVFAPSAGLTLGESLGLSTVATRSGIACCVVMADEVAGREIRMRLDFNPLAAFVSVVRTDIKGRAAVGIVLPDNLTRYRIMAIAVEGGNRFGTGESTITARLPLMVRPSAPRFLNYGDRFELPVVVQNQTDKAMQVSVAVRASNARFISKHSGVDSSAAGQRVTIPANDRVEVLFPAKTVMPGTAHFQIAGSSGLLSDAAEISVPVRTPATTEAVAVYGEVDSGSIRLPMQTPSGVIDKFGGLEITTSSTQLQALTDAAAYLQSYPYECAEQVSSRVLANVTIIDTLKAFSAKGLPNPEELNRSVNSDIRKLASMQNSDGGFGFWSFDQGSWPYLSIHVAHALQRAKDKGFIIPDVTLERSQEYLRKIEERIPGRYGADPRRSIMAYALYVRNLMGDRDLIKAHGEIILEGGIEKYTLEALGWLLPVLSGDKDSEDYIKAIYRRLNAGVVETANTANFTVSYTDGAHLLLHSNRRTDAVILSALIDDNPGNDLIPKLARGLLAHRKRGRWLNTQENAFALLALDRYFQVYEKSTPDFLVRTWFGNGYAGEKGFRGRITESHTINIPMSFISKQGKNSSVVLAKEGAGRMYYRVGLQYASSDLQIEPADYGFTVNRAYEAIDDPGDVRLEEDGTWRIRAGARVRVRLTMYTPVRRYHVALVDPLPAGFEVLNPELAVTEPIPEDKDERGSGHWWSRWNRWYEHQNMRDDRVEAFASLLWEGVWKYSFVARATTPGVYLVPPSKAEEMYSPETFGRGATDRVVIETGKQ